MLHPTSGIVELNSDDSSNVNVAYSLFIYSVSGVRSSTLPHHHVAAGIQHVLLPAHQGKSAAGNNACCAHDMIDWPRSALDGCRPSPIPPLWSIIRRDVGFERHTFLVLV